MLTEPLGYVLALQCRLMISRRRPEKMRQDMKLTLEYW